MVLYLFAHYHTEYICIYGILGHHKMAFLAKRMPSSVTTRSLLLIFFLAAGFFLILLSLAQIRVHAKTEFLSLFSGGILAILSACVLSTAPQFGTARAHQWLTRFTLGLLVLLCCTWAALIAYVHKVQGWDEGSYILSGLALRGYHVPYASWRAPVTGFLCAAFVGGERVLNPLLLTLLLFTLYFWLRHLLGPLPAALSLLMLISQNLFLDSSVEIMSELPAALLLLLGFFFLAREWFWLSALFFTLVAFTRWNLAPVSVVVFLAVLLRFGLRESLKFLCIALAVFSAWYVITDAMRTYVDWPGVRNPFEMVYEGNFLPALAWTANPDEKPDFFLRVNFYVRHLFFLTPFVLFALIASPVQSLHKHLRTELWVVLMVLPFSLLVYLGTMLCMGALFPRFITPLIPSGLVCLLCWLFKSSEGLELSEERRIQFVTVVVFVTCAVGLWPMSAVGHVRAEQKTPNIFSSDLRKKLIALDRTVSLCGFPREPLSRMHANPAMAEARHFILFPSARRDPYDGIVEEPETIESVDHLIKACPAGDPLLIPKQFTSQFQASAVVASDERWALVYHR